MTHQLFFKFQDLNLENVDDALSIYDISSILEIHKRFIKDNLKFESSNELGVIANGWVN